MTMTCEDLRHRDWRVVFTLTTRKNARPLVDVYAVNDATGNKVTDAFWIERMLLDADMWPEFARILICNGRMSEQERLF